jgi:hypothetical protein
VAEKVEKEEKKIIKLDLEELYDNVSVPECRASDVLEAILKAWGLKHVLLMNASPDVGDEFFDRGFENEYKKIERQIVNGEIDEEDFVTKYAEKKGGKAVMLYDGYEWAYAIVFEK